MVDGEIARERERRYRGGGEMPRERERERRYRGGGEMPREREREREDIGVVERCRELLIKSIGRKEIIF